MRKTTNILLLLTLVLSISSCGSQQTSPTDIAPGPNSATSTPTSQAFNKVITPTTPPSKCSYLQAEFDVQVLVGPAEIVGLKPFSVGQIPFAVTTSQPPYLAQGQGNLSYSDVLVEEWGTYEVDLNLDTSIQGECIDKDGGEMLPVVIEMTGDQLVEVTADEGFHMKLPWEGTHTWSMDFPLEEGAFMEGEGYVFVLHLLSE